MRDKNWVKVRIFTWSLVAILLSVFLILNLQGFVNVFNGDFSSMDYSNGKNMKTIKEYTFDNVEDIKNITANISTSDMEFRENKDNEIKIIVKSNKDIKDKDFVKAKVSSDTLNIEDTVKRKKINIIGVNKGFYIDIQVLVPKSYNGNLDITNKVGDLDFASDFQFNNINVYNKVGDVDISNKLSANKVLLDCKVGSIEANELEVKDLIVNAKTGDIEIKNFTGQGSLDTGVGDVEIDIEKLSGNLDIKANVGDIDISINPKENFSFQSNKNLDSISSSLDFHDVSLSSKSFKGNYGPNPINLIKVNTNTGEISINN